MSGKALLILVIGFTMIFLGMGYLWESVATRSVDNHISYVNNTIARNIAVSGANIALSALMKDSNWVSDINNRDFSGGKMTVTISPLDSERILISTGYLPQFDVEQTVRVKLKRGQRIFEEYAWFIPSVSTGSVNRPWITGDSVWGGFHTNQFLVVDGNPVFFGKVTTLKGIADQAKKPNVSDPKFLGGYQSGINVSWNSEMTFPDYAAQAEAGKNLGGKCYYNPTGPGVNLWLTFNEDGTVTYRTGTSNPADDSSKYGVPETLPLSEFAPTGVVYLNKGNVFVSGKVNGQLTVVCEGSAGGTLQSGQGNVGLVGDLTYVTDPMIPNGSGGYKANPECDDLLGIITTNSFIVSTSTVSGGYQNNVANPNVNVDAGIFCVKGGFLVEGLNTLPGPTGTLYLQGSMTAGMEEMVAQFNGNNITKGYNRHVIFDSRFAVTPPSWYTYVTYFKIISWLE